MQKNEYIFSNTTIFSKSTYYEGVKNYFWKNIMKTMIIFCITITVCIGAFVYVVLANPGRVFYTFLGYTGIILLGAFEVAMIFFPHLKIKNDYKKLIKSGKVPSQQYFFGKQNISVTTNNSNSFINYNQISSIYQTQHTCILSLDDTFPLFDNLLLDKNGFTQGSYEEFCDFIKSITDAPWK